MKHLITALRKVLGSFDLHIEILMTQDYRTEQNKNKHHVFNYEDLLNAVTYPENIHDINYYDDDMNVSGSDIAKQLENDLPSGIKVKPSANKIKVEKPFKSGEKPPQEKKWKEPSKQEFEKMMKEERRKEKGKTKLKSV